MFASSSIIWRRPSRVPDRHASGVGGRAMEPRRSPPPGLPWVMAATAAAGQSHASNSDKSCSIRVTSASRWLSPRMYPPGGRTNLQAYEEADLSWKQRAGLEAGDRTKGLRDRCGSRPPVDPAAPLGSAAQLRRPPPDCRLDAAWALWPARLFARARRRASCRPNVGPSQTRQRGAWHPSLARDAPYEH